MPYRPIEDYALIGDGTTVALVSSHGSIDWACFPRVDSPSVFARLLDAGAGGYFQIAPVGEYAVSRRYLPDTNVLEITFRTDGGVARLVDFMPPFGLTLQQPTDNTLVRQVYGVEGGVEFEVLFQPGFDYARARCTWMVEPESGVRALHGDSSLTLYAEVPLAQEDDRATARFVVGKDETRSFVLTYRSAASMLWRHGVVGAAPRLLDRTIEHWRQWIGRCSYDGPHATLVRRSALVLKLLDYQPSGAIVAAATTSLPEKIGGVRNWDYRYAWLRDTAFTLYAFFVLGYHAEAESFFEWILDVAGGDPRTLQIMYGVEGERELEERELPHLEGYRRSRPVRIGNGAYDQRQHDIYGEVIDCAFLYAKAGGRITPPLWEFVSRTADYVCEHWDQPDFGIWEVRTDPRHFVYSKALSWVALDRAVKLATRRNLPADVARWDAARQAISESIDTHGYNEEVGAFTQAYDTKELDAAALALMLRKVAQPDDPRMHSTVDRIMEHLSEDGLLHRYKADDGLPPGEGVFLMCSFWMVDCYAELGRLEEARALFDRLIGYANDVGLYAEEYDLAGDHHLGNFPQAFTHVALINAAATLHRYEQKVEAPRFAPRAG
jgi:GH15 family glucan-1,4-alpha-glucosidase